MKNLPPVIIGLIVVYFLLAFFRELGVVIIIACVIAYAINANRTA